MIKKTMCIGSACGGFGFAQIFDIRIAGPVDNMHGWNFKSTLDVFNGKLFDAILNDKISYKEENIGVREWDDDNYFRYYCSNIGEQWNWRTMHTNFERSDRKKLFEERIKLFNKFNNELDSDSFYLYTISDGDNNLTEDEFVYVLNNLPSNVLDKLIVISSFNCPVPSIFCDTFRCIQNNLGFIGEEITLESAVKWKNFLFNDKK